MAVKLRLTRLGRRHRPFFRIIAIDSREPRDGKILEKLGHYDPIEKDKDKQIVLNVQRARYWLDKGAIPTDTVSQILLRKGIKHKYADEEAVKRQKARTIAKAKGKPFTKADQAAIEKAAQQAEEKAKAEPEAKEKQKAEVKEETVAEEKQAETSEAEKKEIEEQSVTEQKADEKASEE